MKYYPLVPLLLLWISGLAHCSAVPAEMRQIGQGHAYYLNFIKVYTATLYGDQQVTEQNILSPGNSKCLHLDYTVDVGRQDFIEAAKTVLARQHPAQQLDQVQVDIDSLHRKYQDVQKGDSYTLCYDSNSQQTTLALNSRPIITITSLEFASVYFGIWLGAQAPLDEELRSDLLAGLSSP